MKMISSKRREITGEKNPFFSDYFIFSQILTIIYSRTTWIGLSSIDPDSLCPSLQNSNKRCRLSSIHCQLFSLQRNSKKLQTRNSTLRPPSPLSKMRSSPIASMYKRKAFKNYCFVKCLEYTRTGPYAFIVSFVIFVYLFSDQEFRVTELIANKNYQISRTWYRRVLELIYSTQPCGRTVPIVKILPTDVDPCQFVAKRTLRRKSSTAQFLTL